MTFKAPFFSKEELRHRAGEFSEKHNPDGAIPVPIERIVENSFGMDIVPIPGLQQGFDVVAYVTKDMREIRVDQNVMFNRPNRYRFSLAHELAHCVLHDNIWREIEFNNIDEWKAIITESIPEREYSFIEFHANFFAGNVLVPIADLRIAFFECAKLASEHGIDLSEVATGGRDTVEAYIARRFEVSTEVVHRRVEFDELWSDV